MRAPAFTPSFTPVEAYHARYSAPGGPGLGAMIGRVLTAGGAELGPAVTMRTVIQGLTDDTAGRARALQDQAAMRDLVDNHAGLLGGAAVAAQSQTLGELARIKAEGQAALATPGMAEAYNAQIGPAIDDASSRVTSHSLNQALVERKTVSDLAMQAAQRGAASDWQNPARFVQGLETVQSLAAAQAGPLANDDDRAQAMRGAAGGAVAQAVGHALAAGEPEFAAHIIGGWGATMSPAAYQLAVARVGQAAQNQRSAAIFAQAAGGNPTGASSAMPERDAEALSAPVGAAIHPIAGGSVTAIGGTPDNASVEIAHPDGSSSVYGGLGQTAVAPGDVVAPAHVIGSASPLVTLRATTPAGTPADAGALLRDAGGIGAMVGSAQTPRSWDAAAMLDRIAQRQDLSAADKVLAANLARQRISADDAQLTANDRAAGRSLVSLVAAAPNSFGQAADIPADLAARMTPTTLANVDSALRGSAQAATAPLPDNSDALRLELLRRHAPAQFAQVNLAPMIGTVHPDDLGRLATSQSIILAGQPVDDAVDHRSVVLDALARHEFTNGVALPDAILPTVRNQAETALRLNQVDPADRPTIDSTVAAAIQNQLDRP